MVQVKRWNSHVSHDAGNRLLADDVALLGSLFDYSQGYVRATRLSASDAPDEERQTQQLPG